MHATLIGAAIGCLLCASAASAQDGASADTAEAKPREPRPALMAPLAAKWMLLDVARAGQRLVAVGDYGDIVVADGGGGWHQVQSPVDVMLTRVFFLDAQNGWAVGWDGAILHTADGGQSWTLQRWVPDKGPLFDVLFLDPQNGWAVGSYGRLLRTADGGKTWNAVDADISEPGLHFNAIVRLADGSLFIAGERGLLARSGDGGASWSLLDSPYKGSLFGALPWGEHGVLAFGLRGNIYVSDDLRTAKTVPVKGWDEFDHDTTADAAAVARLGWRHLDNPSQASLLRGLAGPDGALLTGINGAIVQVSTGQDQVSLPQSGENETLSGLARLDDRWFAAGVRGVHPLKIETGAHP